MFMSPQYDTRNKKFYDDTNDEENRNAMSCQNSKSKSGMPFDQNKQAFPSMSYNRGSKLGEMVTKDKRQAKKSEFFNLNLQIKNPEPNTQQNINIQI